MKAVEGDIHRVPRCRHGEGGLYESFELLLLQGHLGLSDCLSSVLIGKRPVGVKRSLVDEVLHEAPVGGVADKVEAEHEAKEENGEDEEGNEQHGRAALAPRSTHAFSASNAERPTGFHRPFIRLRHTSLPTTNLGE